MKLKTRIEKGKFGGYRARVYCEMHNGKWLWSESNGVERANRQDAQTDAKWLLDCHKRATWLLDCHKRATNRDEL